MERKLKPLQLKPLDRSSSELYLRRVGQRIPEETGKKIFEWTSWLSTGNECNDRDAYPFDLEKDADQRRLVNILTARVIDEKFLQTVKATRTRQGIRSHWGYFRFLVVLTCLLCKSCFQNLPQTLVSDYKSKLAYMALPADSQSKYQCALLGSAKGWFHY